MALIACGECGKEMSDQALACPHCGYAPAAVAAQKKKREGEVAGSIGSLLVLGAVAYYFWGPISALFFGLPASNNNNAASLSFISDTFPQMEAATGCNSKYSDDKKADIFSSRYAGHLMSFVGMIETLDKDHVGLKVLPATLSYDVGITLLQPGAGYNLRKGQMVTIVARVTSAGGCFTPYDADRGQIAN